MNVLEGIETNLTPQEQQEVLKQMLKGYEADALVAKVNVKLAKLAGDEQAVTVQMTRLRGVMTAVEALKETLSELAEA